MKLIVVFFAPFKGIQDSLGFWIPNSWYRIQVFFSGTGILDSNR